MSKSVHVTDHAVLRYLERAHGLDVEAVRRHLAGRVLRGARLGAVSVKIENVKLVLHRTDNQVRVVTALEARWLTRDPGG
ncbi:hypothetical protein [Nitratireductor sp. GZWM139]|uniref:hypothetical protein n=1 Tax=Nitratireductor sp. GZWM139 TaxID=2950541 RepID=UPI0024BEA999|nr:hypothetical protein [Nitratireductor sp. GZWM139]MDJ1463426.1 hypothetical protein [Nitratireductor sp. GZWM139]